MLERVPLLDKHLDDYADVVEPGTLERIRTLAAGRQRAGTWRLFWDGKNDFGKDPGPGIYFIRVRIGNTPSTHKIVRR